MEDFYEGALAKAILVASDGDYAPLVKKLHDNECFHTIVSPAPSERCSILLKKLGVKISNINDQRSILEKR
jgi:hypothetical protein